MKEMTNRQINNYYDFVKTIKVLGFAPMDNKNGIYSIQSFFTDNIKWWTGDKDVDPWCFRHRVLNEKEDIAYAKLFSKKTGYIHKAWYPYFFAIRRGENELYQEYVNGNIILEAKLIYDLIKEHKKLALHKIKEYCRVTKENKSRFDRALVLLQMKMYITICGGEQRISKVGLPYGDFANVFCLVEDFFDHDVFEAAHQIKNEEAVEKIKSHILKYSPEASDKNIKKFIFG